MRYPEWVEKYSNELVREPVLMPHVEVPMSPAQYEELKIFKHIWLTLFYYDNYINYI